VNVEPPSSTWELQTYTGICMDIEVSIQKFFDFGFFGGTTILGNLHM
jgi:hypothetical protein